MKKIHLIWPVKSLREPDDLVAVFDNESLANAFIHRNPEFEGSYEIELRELNPSFQVSNLPPFLVILDPLKKEEPNVVRITCFDDESIIQSNPVCKYDDTFFMYLSARDENNALATAIEKMDELLESGGWIAIKDEADAVT